MFTKKSWIIFIFISFITKTDGCFPLCNYNIGVNRINVKPYFDFFAGLYAEGHHSRDKDQAGCAHNEVKEDILKHFKNLLVKKR